jgi:hypothetical protein
VPTPEERLDELEAWRDQWTGVAKALRLASTLLGIIVALLTLAMSVRGWS